MHANPTGFGLQPSTLRDEIASRVGRHVDFYPPDDHPQVLTIWVGHQAAGVSLFTWSAYLLSAVLWFWFGVQKQDNLPCIGWIVLDVAVIVGAVIYG